MIHPPLAIQAACFLGSGFSAYSPSFLHCFAMRNEWSVLACSPCKVWRKQWPTGWIGTMGFCIKHIWIAHVEELSRRLLSLRLFWRQWCLPCWLPATWRCWVLCWVQWAAWPCGAEAHQLLVTSRCQSVRHQLLPCVTEKDTTMQEYTEGQFSRTQPHSERLRCNTLRC